MVHAETVRSNAEQVQPRAKDLVHKLREHAKANKAFNSVCHIFALRERTRQQITMANLRQTMTKAGFQYSGTEYAGILKFLATNGIGKLHSDSKGNILALKDIKITLQSIGKAAVTDEDKLENFKPGASFTELPPMVKIHPPAEPAPLKKAAPPANDLDKGFEVSLTVSIAGRPVNFVLPQKLSASELGDFMYKFFGQNPTLGALSGTKRNS